MADESSSPDLSRMSFQEFVTFFFDREAGADENWAIGLYSFDWWRVASPRIMVRHMTFLFEHFTEVSSKYSLQQINAGMWAMLGEPFRLEEFLWQPALPLSDRLACVRSMYSVYSQFVSKSQVKVMENCFSMWFDQVANSFWFKLECERKIKEGDVTALDRDARALLDAMFETLERILALPDRRTQWFALHGLGHLHHPDVRQLVQDFIDHNRSELSEEGLKWAEQCRDGTVM